MGDLRVNDTQNRTIDEVKNERRYRRLRPERQREQATTGQRHEEDHHRKPSQDAKNKSFDDRGAGQARVQRRIEQTPYDCPKEEVGKPPKGEG